MASYQINIWRINKMYDIENVKQVAKTIISQMGGSGKLSAMVNAKFTVSPNIMGVCFKFSGSTKVNYCQIVLNGLDLYDMTLSKYNKNGTKTVFTENDMYSEMLKKTFEKETGLYLSL